MRNPCEESHDHAEGHPVSETNPRYLGRLRMISAVLFSPWQALISWLSLRRRCGVHFGSVK